MRLYLQQNNKTKDTQPDFRLSVPPEQDGDEWVELGAFWQAKSGKGFNGKLKEGITINIGERPSQPEKKETIEYPDEGEIDPDTDIPF